MELTFFNISYIILWILFVPLLLLNLVLFRQLGIMVMGTARGVNNSGIPVGNKIPNISTYTRINNEIWEPSMLDKEPTLVFFGSPHCAECKEIMPELDGVESKYGVKTLIILLTDLETANNYVTNNNIKTTTIVGPSNIAEDFDIVGTPFAYGVNKDGVITGKGLINSREQLESISISAKNLKVA